MRVLLVASLIHTSVKLTVDPVIFPYACSWLDHTLLLASGTSVGFPHMLQSTWSYEQALAAACLLLLTEFPHPRADMWEFCMFPTMPLSTSST